jgi:CO/xanthine dehydrogenase Mo-binding subunit
MSDDELAKILEQLDNLRADKYPLPKYDIIGKRGIRRIDGYEKASGAAIYTMDIQLPGMLYLRFLTCPYPHARIKSLDTSKAAALPGVRSVLRYDDPDIPAEAMLGGHEIIPTTILPAVAHFQGEEVGCAVVADTEDIAEQALKLIEVEWEERPFVLDEEEALKPDAPLANPESYPDGNLYSELTSVQEHGNVEEGFAEADTIIEFKFRQGLNTWVGPEVPCGVWRWNGEYPEVWVKQQRPHISKRSVASWFGGIPMNKIKLHCLYQGASFGGWSQMSWNHGGTYLAAVASKRTGRPVKWNFSRREDFYGGEMDLGVYSYKVGAKKDGTITAVQGRAVLANQGLPAFGFIKHFMENTKVPHVYGKQYSVQVNKGPTTAVRCEQNPNAHSMAQVFGHVAGALGLDPVEVALKNDGCEGHDMEWLNKKKKELGFPIRDSLKECVEKGKKAIGWDEKWHLPGTRRLPNGRLHGMGFTWTHEWDDSGGTSEIAIRIERNDGTASIYGCRADIGVNQETALCQIAAEELGLRIQDVYYRPHEDTGFFPMTPDTSTSMCINAYAIRNASRLLRRRILESAVNPTGRSQLGSYPPSFPGKKPEDLDIKDSIIFEKANPSNKITMADFVKYSGAMGPMSSPTGEPLIMGPGKKPKGYAFREPLFDYSFQVQTGTYMDARLRMCRQAHFMEVEVDDETGEVFVTRVTNVNDVGKVLNIDGCEGQQYGGTIMALGRGRSEEVVYDPNTGVMLNGNLLNYKIPTMLDFGHIDTLLVESGLGYGPYGSTGIGEDIATVVPMLIGPAIYNATGKWVEEYPATPDKVLKALGKA